MLTQNETMGPATAIDGGSAPIAAFGVRIMTSCISIKRGVYQSQRDNAIQGKSLCKFLALHTLMWVKNKVLANRIS